MANEVNVIDKDGNVKETIVYDARFSAVYVLQLVWCNLHRVNMYNKKLRERAKQDFEYDEDSVWFEFDGCKFICKKQETRKNVYEGINETPLDF